MRRRWFKVWADQASKSEEKSSEGDGEDTMGSGVGSRLRSGRCMPGDKKDKPKPAAAQWWIPVPLEFSLKGPRVLTETLSVQQDMALASSVAIKEIVVPPLPVKIGIADDQLRE